MRKFISQRKKSFSDNASVQRASSSWKKISSKLKWLDPFIYVDLWVMPRVKKRTQSKLVEHGINVLFAFLFAGILYLILGLLFGSSSPLVVIFSGSMEPNYFRGDVMGLMRPNNNTFFGNEVTLNQNLKNVHVNSFSSPVFDSSGSFMGLNFNNGQFVSYEKKGSVVVYSAYNPNFPQFHNKPIIHRSIVKIKALDGTFILTKGDNDLTNKSFDQDCGNVDPLRLLPEQGKPCITLYPIKIDDLQGVGFFNIPKVGCVKLWLLDDLLSIALTGKLPSDFKDVC